MLLRAIGGAIAAGAAPINTTPTARAAGGFMGAVADDVRLPVLLQVADADSPLAELEVIAVTQGAAGSFAVSDHGRLVAFSRGGAPVGGYTGSYTVRDALGNQDTEIVTVLVTDADADLFADGTAWTDDQGWLN